MSTNDLNLTLVGWVATAPRLYTGPGTNPYTSFRMASTRRYFDRAQNVWVDGRTEWFTVKCWRQQARNVAESLRKSDPVVVTGRLATQEWTGPEGARTTLVLEALAIGADLSFGSAKFSRTVHVAGSDQGAADADAVNDSARQSDPDAGGVPDDADPWMELAGDSGTDLEDDGEAVPKDDELGSLSVARAIT